MMHHTFIFRQASHARVMRGRACLSSWASNAREAGDVREDGRADGVKLSARWEVNGGGVGKPSGAWVQLSRDAIEEESAVSGGEGRADRAPRQNTAGGSARDCVTGWLMAELI